MTREIDETKHAKKGINHIKKMLGHLTMAKS